MRIYFLALGTVLLVCFGCVSSGQHVSQKSEYVAPPAAQLAAPGPMVAGPGPGVLAPMGGPMMGHIQPVSAELAPACPPGLGAAAGYGYGVAPGAAADKSQVRFLGPEGMIIGWQAGQTFAENQLIAPGRYNFPQSATYRLKLSDIPGRPGLELYPTLMVYPEHPTTAAYLDHNTIPIRITEKDFAQVATNNFVTKVIYLPDPRFQELAVAGVEELISTELDPGLDPVAEAARRGTIMAVLRMGNVDVEMPIAGDGVAANAPNGQIQQVQAIEIDGASGQFVAPTPIANHLGNPYGVPQAMIVAESGRPACPTNMPMWGMPHTGTPIGLPGPPHIPYGRPAGLRSHTMRNLTDVQMAGPVNDLLIDVKHEPGIRMPNPVRHVQYTERHPIYSDGQVSYPATRGIATPGVPYAGAQTCPPGQLGGE